MKLHLLSLAHSAQENQFNWSWHQELLFPPRIEAQVQSWRWNLWTLQFLQPSPCEFSQALSPAVCGQRSADRKGFLLVTLLIAAGTGAVISLTSSIPQHPLFASRNVWRFQSVPVQKSARGMTTHAACMKSIESIEIGWNMLKLWSQTERRTVIAVPRYSSPEVTMGVPAERNKAKSMLRILSPRGIGWIIGYGHPTIWDSLHRFV